MRIITWRPPDGWNAFTYEIVKIVLGVLIALGTGVVADRIGWRNNVASTRDSLNDEVAVNASYALDRLAIDDCQRERIAALGAALRQPGPWKGNPLPVVAGATKRQLPRAYGVPVRPWQTAAWSAALADGSVGHMSRDTSQLYAMMYRSADVMRDAQEQEAALTPLLAPLADDRPLDADQRIAMIQTLSRLENLNNLQVAVASQLMPMIGRAGVLQSQDRLDAINVFPPIQRKLRGACVRILVVGRGTPGDRRVDVVH